jgi:hypothetical protein
MNDDPTVLDQTDEQILTHTVSDEALERSAASGETHLSLIDCFPSGGFTNKPGNC